MWLFRQKSTTYDTQSMWIYTYSVKLHTILAYSQMRDNCNIIWNKVLFFTTICQHRLLYEFWKKKIKRIIQFAFITPFNGNDDSFCALNFVCMWKFKIDKTIRWCRFLVLKKQTIDEKTISGYSFHFCRCLLTDTCKVFAIYNSKIVEI